MSSSKIMGLVLALTTATLVLAAVAAIVWSEFHSSGYDVNECEYADCDPGMSGR
jgi:hypothetical protein